MSSINQVIYDVSGEEIDNPTVYSIDKNPRNVSKVVFGITTLVDLTDSTVATDNLLRGEVAYGADGSRVVGAIDQEIDYLQVGGTVSLDENDYMEFDDSGDGSVTVTDEPNATGTTCVIMSESSPTPPSPTTWETLYNGSVNINEDSGGNYIYISQSETVLITQDSLWQITWNGTSTEHVPIYEQYDQWTSAYCIDGMNDGTNTPYSIWSVYDAWIISVGNLTGTISLKIERAVTT